MRRSLFVCYYICPQQCNTQSCHCLPTDLQIRTMHQQFANRGSEEELCYQVDMDVNNASLHVFTRHWLCKCFVMREILFINSSRLLATLNKILPSPPGLAPLRSLQWSVCRISFCSINIQTIFNMYQGGDFMPHVSFPPPLILHEHLEILWKTSPSPLHLWPRRRFANLSIKWPRTHKESLACHSQIRAPAA